MKKGTRLQVMRGSALMTTGGLTKNDLIYNKNGKIVSKKLSYLSKMRGGANGANGAKIIPTTRLIISKNNIRLNSQVERLEECLKIVYPNCKKIVNDKFINNKKDRWTERERDNFINENILVYDIGQIDDIPDKMDLESWNRENYFINNGVRMIEKDQILTQYEFNIINLFNIKRYTFRLSLHTPGSGFIFPPKLLHSNGTVIENYLGFYCLYICCDISIKHYDIPQITTDSIHLG